MDSHNASSADRFRELNGVSTPDSAAADRPKAEVRTDDKTEEGILEILRHNKGFDDPAPWVSYARTQGFKKIMALKLYRCPDCHCTDAEKIGQYVFYSTLISLMECSGCGLGYSNILLSNETITQHFEVAYKDQDYFLEERFPIFLQVARIIREKAPFHDKILDVGGARGHLAVQIRRLRPDLCIVVNDLSTRACRFAESEFGFKTVVGSLENIDPSTEKYDWVLLRACCTNPL